MKNTIVIAKDKESAAKITEALNLDPGEIRIHTGFNSPVKLDENGNPLSTINEEGQPRFVYDDKFAENHERIVTGLYPLDRLVGSTVEYANNYPRLHFTRIAVLGVKDEAAFEKLKETKGFQEAFGTKAESRVGAVASSEDVDF